MKSPRIFFLNRFYWPDEPATAQLLTDLATALAEDGFNISVIASSPKTGEAPLFEEREGVSIHRVRTLAGNRGGTFYRLVEFGLFHCGALGKLWRQLRRGDVAVAMTDPPLLGVGVWLVATLRQARVIHWVQDIYPEIAAELTGHRWLLGLRPLRNTAWRRASRCIVPGRDMARVVQHAGVATGRVVHSPNWAPARLAPAPSNEIEALRAAWNLTGQFVLAYSGNLGRVHDLEPLLDLAEILRDDRVFTFLFVGRGPQQPALEAAARARRLTNVRFMPAQSRGHLAVSLGAGDVHFVTLRPGAQHSVFPSKLYGIAAIGRPVIFIGPKNAEITALVESSGIGRSFERDDLLSIAKWVRTLAASSATRSGMSVAGPRFAGNGFASARAVWRRELAATLLLPSEPRNPMTA